jgi:CBS domain-containing protein
MVSRTLAPYPKQSRLARRSAGVRSARKHPHFKRQTMPQQRHATTAVAGDVMTRNVITAKENDLMVDAIDWMCRYNISGLPVVDDQRRVVGVISEFVVLETIYEPEVSRLKVHDCMSRRVITVSPQTTLKEVVDRLVLHRIRRVLVVDENDVLLGVVSRRDLVRYAHDRLVEPAHSQRTAPQPTA